MEGPGEKDKDAPKGKYLCINQPERKFQKEHTVRNVFPQNECDFKRDQMCVHMFIAAFSQQPKVGNIPNVHQ